MSTDQRTSKEITMYSAEWCGDCRRSKAFLDGHEVAYEYVDLEAHPEAAEIAQSIAGRKNIPVIVFKDGHHLVEPSDAILHAELKVRGII